MKELKEQILEEFEALPVDGMTTQEFISLAVERAYRLGKMDGAALIPDEVGEDKKERYMMEGIKVALEEFDRVVVGSEGETSNLFVRKVRTALNNLL